MQQQPLHLNDNEPKFKTIASHCANPNMEIDPSLLHSERREDYKMLKSYFHNICNGRYIEV
eukprot:CAMPEP_0183739126 /NCGR_PEP_ID=MMETSP0737-20130205/56290_1 /TAXON_ID=385413 /ORGANISM="Thalassiosira miniscula, Strain CCMP1093" /LENGTH=60 /DNA_ID=CAMNT_0025973843 /DNA_START=1 /DNA_END=179 /DNA_ORIENTATION=-